MTAEAPAAAAKPDYRIPTMAELAERRGTAGLKFVSTFSGCGGSCLGLEWACYEPLLASEFIPSAIETYAANHPGVPIETGDIRELTAEAVLERTGLDIGELDVLEGSPPCESFSTSGLLQRRWGRQSSYADGISQRLDDLFFDFARLVGGLRPRAFVAENVSGLVKGVSKGYFKIIHRTLEEQGYRVEARMLDAQWLGVPQVRKRVIFVGVRDDLGKEPAFPDPLPYRYSLRDAVPWVGEIIHTTGRMGKKGVRHPGDQPSPTVMRGGMYDSGHGQVLVVDDPVATGAPLRGNFLEEWRKLRPGEDSDRYFDLYKLHPDASRTVTRVSGASNRCGVTHPFEPRKFSIPELRRLCGFPDDFVLTGSYSQQWERLGNAVPPPMMYHVACALRDRVLT